jgi:minor histocompatibility antigen H13
MDSLFSHFEGGSPVLQFIGNRLQYVYDHHEQFGMYLHLILSALFPIIIGAHASLKRPPSSAPSEKEGGDTEEDDELDGEVNQDLLIEGLTPSDAILFPVIAGLTLGSLYLVIKWMKDAKILNKILNYYFSGKLLGHVVVSKSDVESSAGSIWSWPVSW